MGARLVSALVSQVTLAHPAGVLRAQTTALAMERAVRTGTLLTTGLLLKLSRCILRPHLITPSCSRRFTSLPTTMLGTATSATWPLWTPPRSPTSSCSTTHRSVPQDGRMLTLRSQAQLEMEVNRPLCKTAITTVITFLTTMAARCTDATALCLAKTALVVVSVIIPLARASVSADTQALLVRRWKRCRKLIL